ncbi:hypothetical protein BH18ACT5_BH18ACT5_16940 [soil metagenome]
MALSQAALESIDVATLLQMAVEKVASVAHADIVNIIERTHETSGVIRASFGDLLAIPGVTSVDLPSDSPAGYAIGREAVTVVQDLATDVRFHRQSQLLDLGVVSGMDSVIPSRRGTWGTLGIWTKQRRRFSREDTQFAEVVACLVGWVVSQAEVETRLAEAVREKDQGLRLEMALSRCAQALLGDYDPAAVEVCLRALMEATNSSFGFIDWEGQHFRVVPSIRLSRNGRSDELDRHWDQISWDKLPTLSRGLEHGQSVAVKVLDLPTDEAAMFLTAPELVMSELDVPIMTNGWWTGTIGLGARDENRIWDPEETKAVEHAASLFSSWWEKRDYALRLEEAVESRNRQIKLEQSVAAAAQLLRQSNEPGDLNRALNLLRDGAQTTSVFVERNVENGEGELCSRVVAVAQSPDSV